LAASRPSVSRSRAMASRRRMSSTGPPPGSRPPGAARAAPRPAAWRCESIRGCPRGAPARRAAGGRPMRWRAASTSTITERRASRERRIAVSLP
jgi:hypothetical protein